MSHMAEPDSPSSASSSRSSSSVPCARVMPQKFQAKPGAEIFPGVTLGRELGAGVQAAVYDLVGEAAKGRVLKIGHSDLGHKLFLNSMASSMMSLEHEWELGMVLKAALETPEGTLPGFTRTCDCMMVQEEGRSGKVHFQGMIMEKLNGESA